jgi:hypothetical protein
MFTSKDVNNEGLVVTDKVNYSVTTGMPTILGDLIWPNDATILGSISYKTGVYTFDFPSAPLSGEPVYAQVVSYAPARPMSVLYFDGTFTLRPVPDNVYQVCIETYVRPESLANDPAAEPLLEQHYQYIALGAAKKIFEDRMDMESVQLIMPEFKQQELLCLRTTIVQKSNERVSTIYVQSVDPVNNGWGWNNYF